MELFCPQDEVQTSQGRLTFPSDLALCHHASLVFHSFSTVHPQVPQLPWTTERKKLRGTVTTLLASKTRRLPY